jgi:hypothetical protein
MAEESAEILLELDESPIHKRQRFLVLIRASEES